MSCPRSAIGSTRFFFLSLSPLSLFRRWFFRVTIPGGARYRPVYRITFYIFIADIFLLGYLGAQPPMGYVVLAGQVATFIYFTTFFILPFVSKREDKWLRARLPQELLVQFDRTNALAKGLNKGDAQ